jgi:hypothetical protein
MRDWKIRDMIKEFLRGDPGIRLKGSWGELVISCFKYNSFFEKQVTFLYRIFPNL